MPEDAVPEEILDPRAEGFADRGPLERAKVHLNRSELGAALRAVIEHLEARRPWAGSGEV